MHCHTKEGSLDSNVPVETFARQFRILGYDGFMIADHNSYRGCKAWDRISELPEFRDITVIRGIEYDTKDAGHILVIMPDGVYPRILRARGMRLARLIRLVHILGGVCGPAHPYGAGASSLMSLGKVNPKIIRNMDFIEVFNTCELPESNMLAAQLAQKFHLPGVGGSDAHKERYIGMAYTDFNHHITCNNDMIHAIKYHATTNVGGTERIQPRRGKAKEHWIGITAFRIYNRGLGKLVSPRRGLHHFRLRNHRRELRRPVPETVQESAPETANIIAEEIPDGAVTKAQELETDTRPKDD